MKDEKSHLSKVKNSKYGFQNSKRLQHVVSQENFKDSNAKPNLQIFVSLMAPAKPKLDQEMV